MATFPGYNKPSNLWIDAGVLYVGATGLGASRGGFQFDPGMDIRQVPFDGQHAPIAGLDRIITWKSLLKGKMIETTLAASAIYDAGSTSSSITGGMAIVPSHAGQLFPSTAYGQDLYLIGRQQGAGIVKVHFPFFLVVKWPLTTKPHDEGEIDVEIEARLSPTTTDLETPPYDIEYLT